MKYLEFQSWLSQITELSPEQKEEAKDVLQGKPTEENMSLAIIEARVDKERICPHCGVSGAIRRGKARGLKRYQCKSCERTFNALTGTKLSGLHYKERWLAHGKCLAQKKTVVEVGDACGIASNTAFRWRHRFLDAAKSNKEVAQLAGIVEADETYFLNRL